MATSLPSVAHTGEQLKAGMMFLVVDATGATGATNTSFNIHVPRGRPVAEAIFYIGKFAGLNTSRMHTQSDNLMDFKVQNSGSTDLDYGQNWAENGIHEGDTVLLVDV